MDRREVPDVERLRRRGRATLLEGHAPNQRNALLDHRRDHLLVLAVLRALPPAVADSRRQARDGANGLRGVPPRNPAPAPRLGRTDLQHPALDPDAGRRPLRRPRRTRSPRRRHPHLLPPPPLTPPSNPTGTSHPTA